MPDNAHPINKKTVSWGVPWEDAWLRQAIQVGHDIYLSGPFSHDEDGRFLNPAPLDSAGWPSDFSMMEAQMRITYDNIAKQLSAISCKAVFGGAANA